jgi:hypothetical protein
MRLADGNATAVTVTASSGVERNAEAADVEANCVDNDVTAVSAAESDSKLIVKTTLMLPAVTVAETAASGTNARSATF